MSVAFLNEVKKHLISNTKLETNYVSILNNWKFNEILNEKLSNQIKNYKKLPSLNELINNKLEQLLPFYSNNLDTCKEDSINNYLFKFIDNNKKYEIEKSIKLNNLKSYIIKNEIFKEYFEIKEFRKNQISINLNLNYSNELIVNSYINLNLIQFVKLLNDEIFLNSSYFNYYKRFSKLFFNLINENDNNFKLCNKLRPYDLEKLIQILIYSNKKLTNNERIKLKLDEINRILLKDLQESKLKLSNKEMFSLLQLTFQNTKDFNNIINLYNKFLLSENVNKNEDFFKNFLNVNISLGFKNNKLLNKEFTKQIIIDLINNNCLIDRYILKYLLKFSWLIKDIKLSKILILYLIENYSLDNETFNMIIQTLLIYDFEKETNLVKNLFNLNLEINKFEIKSNKEDKIEIDRFNIRLLDHLMEKCNKIIPVDQLEYFDKMPGFTHKIGYNKFLSS